MYLLWLIILSVEEHIGFLLKVIPVVLQKTINWKKKNYDGVTIKQISRTVVLILS